MSKKAELLWVDLEMTGLVPGKDKILEVAAIATNWKLEEISRFEAVVKVDPKFMKERMVGEFWEKNAESRDGLMAQNGDGKKVEEVEAEMIRWMEKSFKGEGKSGVILSGNSIHQDRKFIEIEMPKLNERLHYRMLDVSAWKVYFEGALGKRYVKRDMHRALDDIIGSIEELKWYLTFMK